MTVTDIFNDVLTNAETIALATESTAGHNPDVRIVNLLRLPRDTNTIYFMSVGPTDKVAELAQNNHVAFVTTPIGPKAVRVTDATTTKVADKTEFFNALGAKFPAFSHFDEATKASITVYAATFESAIVITGDGSPVTLNF